MLALHHSPVGTTHSPVHHSSRGKHHSGLKNFYRTIETENQAYWRNLVHKRPTREQGRPRRDMTAGRWKLPWWPNPVARCMEFYKAFERKPYSLVLPLWDTGHLALHSANLFTTPCIPRSFPASYMDDSGIWLEWTIFSGGSPHQIRSVDWRALHLLVKFYPLSSSLSNPPPHCTYSPTSWSSLTTDSYHFSPSPSVSSFHFLSLCLLDS